jgi:hypothetical protein
LDRDKVLFYPERMALTPSAGNWAGRGFAEQRILRDRPK